MRKKTKRITVVITLLCITIIAVQSTAFANGTKSTINLEKQTINSVSELKNEIGNVTEEDGVMTKSEQKIILSKTDPEVYEQFIEEKQSEINEALNDVNIDKIMSEDDNGNYSGEITIDVGDACQVTAKFEDCEERSLIAQIGNFLIEPSFAATNGETIWKSYGNRYFTASKTMMLGAGYSTIKMENHYNLSSSGITERYGYSSAGGVSANGGTVSAQNPYITDGSATTVGKSDVNMSCNYSWSEYAVSGVVTAHGTWRMDTTVGYVDKNATKKQIKVKHSWSVH